MYHGKTIFTSGTYPARRIVVNRRTGQVSALGSLGLTPGEAAYNAAHELDEVVVSAQKVPDYGRVINNAPKSVPWVSPGWPQSETNPTSYGREVPNSPYKPTEYADMQVIEVAGARIPWWMWAAGGLLGAAVLFKFSQR